MSKFTYEYGDSGAMFWDSVGEHYFETGVSKAVLYDLVNNVYTNGVPWNGLISVQESPSGADESKLYADNEKYLSLRGVEEFGGTLECYTYPDAWMKHNGEAQFTYSSSAIPGVIVGQQSRSMFGLCYRTEVGNDVDGQNKGYKIHLVYGCTASPASRQYQTINDSPDAITFSYEFTTDPVAVGVGGVTKKTSLITIDTTMLSATGKTDLATLEAKLYGSEGVIPTMPTPAQVFTLFSTHALT